MTAVEPILIEFLRERTGGLPSSGPELYAMDLRNIIDSLEMIRLIAFIEQSFGIEITDDDVTPETFETVGSTIAFVKTRVPNR